MSSPAWQKGTGRASAVVEIATAFIRTLSAIGVATGMLYWPMSNSVWLSCASTR